MTALNNWSVKDEIREYWSMRAATFDLTPGHEIFTPQEREAWHALIRKHLGEGNGRSVLDLASGTGVISRLLEETGFQVTGLDFSDTMLARARMKGGERKAATRFVSGDAEDTREPDNSYDAITNRHLVWTLPSPDKAFKDWFRVLKPGGSVLILDADMMRRTLKARLLQRLARFLKRFGPSTSNPGVDRVVHDRIVSQVYFSNGAEAEKVAELLAAAGFVDIVIDRDLDAVRKAQGLVMPLHQRLDRASQDRYAIHARKPS